MRRSRARPRWWPVSPGWREPSALPHWSIVNLALDANFMGQEILNPPTVEGWHTGTEWVDTGTLMERVNSAALLVGDPKQPGVQSIINRLREDRTSFDPEGLVDSCLSLSGALEVSEATRRELVSFVADLLHPRATSVSGRQSATDAPDSGSPTCCS